MIKYYLLILTLIPWVIPAGATSTPTDWYPVSVENRPFVRWWWHGSAVSPEGLTYNLEEFASKGLGGVEITPIYGVKDNEANDIDYLSPRWMEMLGYTLSEGARLGLRIEMNNGTGWPFGGPHIGTDYSARKQIVETWEVNSGENVALRIIPSDPQQAAVASLQYLMAFDGDRRIDLTDNVGEDSTLTWTAPQSGGQWRLYALFCGRTFQKVKRAAPGGEGFVVNHYDSVAVKHYLEPFDRAFSSSGCPVPQTFFNDSFEVHGSDWTENLLDEFRSDHGYSLEYYLPEFSDESRHDELRSRVVRDYRATLARLLRENFTNIWMKWAHDKGATIRNQSHGSPANIIDLYAAVDIPECESFGQSVFNIPGLDQSGPSRPSDADPAVLKFASSAAHIMGKKLTSAEALTWLSQHFRTSLANCKPELDQMMCSGVNHIFFHGAPYSPKGAEFPGWLFYASVNMSPTNSIWRDSGALFDYLGRCQSFLSAGEPANDFLLYFPLEDIWHRQEGKPYMMFQIHKMDQTMPDVKQYVAEILSAGYDLDYVTDSLLERMEVTPDGLTGIKDGAKYRAIIIPPVRFMSPTTLKRLISLAEEGSTVVFTGSLPSDVPGLSDLQQRQVQLEELCVALPPVSSRPTIRNIGKGRVIIAPDISSALPLTGVKSEGLKSEHGISFIRRLNEAGGYNYFLTLLQDRLLDGWVTLATPASSAKIFDPLRKTSGIASTRTNGDGATEVRLQLQPGESLLLKTFPYTVEGEDWKYIERKGAPITLDHGWSIRFVESEPPIHGTFYTDTLTQWCDLPVPEAKVNFGTCRYTVEFDLDSASVAETGEWLLDLGDVKESASVTINGQPAGTVWAIPFTLRTDLLKNGRNVIEIDVTNLQANRIADYERRGIEWRIFKDTNINSVTGEKTFSFGDWPVLPSGLNSPVRLIPLSLF